MRRISSKATILTVAGIVSITLLGCSGPGPRSVESTIVSSATNDAVTPHAERSNSSISGAVLPSMQAVPSPSTQIPSNLTPATSTNLSAATAQPTIQVTPQSTVTPQATSTPTPTATIPPIDTPTPHPTPTPEPPLSPSYADPVIAIRIAMLNAGMNPGSNNPIAQSMRQTLFRFFRAYHLVTAPVGEFNRDTTRFQDWLNEFVANQDTNGWTQGYIPYIHLQIWHALYNSESAIWSEIRWLETGLDPVLPGEGPQVYWDYLIEPATTGMDPRVRDALESNFNGVVLDYRTERALNPGIPLAFSTFLLETDFFDAWLTVE